MTEKVKYVLEHLRENKSQRRPKVVKKTEHHVVVRSRGKRNRLSESFESPVQFDNQ
jgi:hypothetical protein